MEENPTIALQTDSATNMLMCLINWLPEHSNCHGGDPPPSMRSHLTSYPILNDYCYLIFILRSRWLILWYTQAYSATRPSWLPWESTASSQHPWTSALCTKILPQQWAYFCVVFLPESSHIQEEYSHDWGVIIVITWPIRLWKLWAGSSGLLYSDCCLAVKVAPTKCVFQASISSLSTTAWRCCLMGWKHSLKM